MDLMVKRVVLNEVFLFFLFNILSTSHVLFHHQIYSVVCLGKIFRDLESVYLLLK